MADALAVRARTLGECARKAGKVLHGRMADLGGRHDTDVSHVAAAHPRGRAASGRGGTDKGRSGPGQGDGGSVANRRKLTRFADALHLGDPDSAEQHGGRRRQRPVPAGGLVARARRRATGDGDVTGAERPLPPDVDRAAYRILPADDQPLIRNGICRSLMPKTTSRWSPRPPSRQPSTGRPSWRITSAG